MPQIGNYRYTDLNNKNYRLCLNYLFPFNFAISLADNLSIPPSNFPSFGWIPPPLVEVPDFFPPLFFPLDKEAVLLHSIFDLFCVLSDLWDLLDGFNNPEILFCSICFLSTFSFRFCSLNCSYGKHFCFEGFAPKLNANATRASCCPFLSLVL